MTGTYSGNNSYVHLQIIGQDIKIIIRVTTHN